MQPTHKRDDNWSRLLARVGKQRDRVAFEILFNHFAPLIKGFCLGKGNPPLSPEAADALVEDVMLNVWQKAPYFDPNRISGTSWIFTVMRNCRVSLAQQRDGRSGSNSGVTIDDIWDDTTEGEPFVFLQRSRGEDSVHQCLQNLPLEQFHIVRKMYMESKSHSEISTELGLPLSTVQSRVRLALNKLEKSMGYRAI